MIWAESVVGQKVENKIYILVSSHHVGHFFFCLASPCLSVWMKFEIYKFSRNFVPKTFVIPQIDLFEEGHF